MRAVSVPPQPSVTRKCHPHCNYPEVGRSQDSDRVITRDDFAGIVLQLALPPDVAPKHIHPGMDAALAAARRVAADHLPGRRRADGGAVGGNACAEPAASPGRLAAPPDHPRRQGDPVGGDGWWQLAARRCSIVLPPTGERYPLASRPVASTRRPAPRGEAQAGFLLDRGLALPDVAPSSVGHSRGQTSMDGTAPSTPLVVGGSPSWLRAASVTVSATGSSDTLSGLAGYESETSSDAAPVGRRRHPAPRSSSRPRARRWSASARSTWRAMRAAGSPAPYASTARRRASRPSAAARWSGRMPPR